MFIKSIIVLKIYKQRFNVGMHITFNPKVLAKNGYYVDIIFYEGNNRRGYKPVVLIEIEQTFDDSRKAVYFLVVILILTQKNLSFVFDTKNIR